ncbi:phage tail protein [Corynebacterium callunae]|uniref:Gp37-like protein n=1 Tax=Corynebacterium callunae TaxID=1721 RepID=UPI003982800C
MLVLDDRSSGLDAETHAMLEAIWEEGQRVRERRMMARRTPPVSRLWDGDWNLISQLTGEIDGSMRWKLNDTGEATITIPAGHKLTPRLINPLGVTTSKNVHLTVDKDGARWSGRLSKARLTKRSDGLREVELIFLHDYEEVKWIYCWPNPFLPAAIQFPRAFTLAGPTAWVLKTALLVNLLRLEGNLWALPDDPLDWYQWDDTFRQQDWNIMVKPGPFIGDPTPWTIISSRMKTWHDLAAKKLADAQLSVECRRWLDGDPDPWEGYTPRHGQLIIDVVDKSGWWGDQGTSFFGSIWEGMVRTVQSLAGNNVDTDITVMSEPAVVPEYQQPNWLGTVPTAPYVVFRDGAISGVEAASFEISPPTAVQMLNGGHSAYGVNEGISAAIQMVGNILGTAVLVPTAGTIADTFLKPIYEDTLFAWTSIKSLVRADELGWSHYHEFFEPGADRAYTLSSLLSLRQAFWETRQKVSHKLEVRDGAPWFVGDQGHGHFFLGDRIGATIKHLPDGLIVVEQVTELEYAWARESRGWSVVCGDQTSQQSNVEKIVANVQAVQSAVHDLGLI